MCFITFNFTEHVPLIILYQKDTEVIQRLIIPTRMQGNVIKVYDQTKHGQRTFIIDHILAAELQR